MVNQTTNVALVAKELMVRNLPTIVLFVVVPVGFLGYQVGAMGFLIMISSQSAARAAGAALLGLGLAAPFLALLAARFAMQVPARMVLAKAMSREEAAARQALEAVGGPAFYNAAMGHAGGAIALGADKLVLALGDLHAGTALKVWTLDRSQLGMVAVQDAPLTVQKPRLNDPAGWRQVVEQRSAHFMQVGLRIKPADARLPELFLQLDGTLARRWERLLEQFRLGTLQAPAASVVFPSVGA